MIHAVVLLLILAPAVARGTQLVVEDKITFPIRRFAVNKFGEEHPLTTLVHCGACVSVWVGIVAALYSWLFLDVPLVFVAPMAFALSYLAIALNKLTE